MDSNDDMTVLIIISLYDEDAGGVWTLFTLFIYGKILNQKQTWDCFKIKYIVIQCLWMNCFANEND